MNVRPLLFAISVLMFLLLAVDHTYAQERDSDLNLPEWAAPSEPEAYESFSSESNAESTAPDMPDAPEAVPIDGGLGLLAAAGAGYAMYRLGRREEVADEEGGSAL